MVRGRKKGKEPRGRASEPSKGISAPFRGSGNGRTAPGVPVPFVFIIVVFALIALAYGFIGPGTWAMDDQVIGRAGPIKTLGDLIGFRRVTQFTFQWNPTFGLTGTAPYRWINVGIHMVCTGMVYWLTFLLPATGAGYPGERKPYRRHLAPVVASLLFGLHPIQTSAVSYVVQRMALLSTFFVLLATVNYILARRARTVAASSILFGLAGLSIAVGFFAKENAVLAIPLIILWELTLNRSGETRIRGTLAPAILAGGALVTGGALVYVSGAYQVFGTLLSLVTHAGTPIPTTGWTATGVFWSPVEHVLTEFRVLALYLRNLLVPLPSFFSFDRWGFPVSIGLLSPPSTLYSLLFVLGLVGFALVFRKKLRYLSFGILWYLLAISLESFVALGSDLYFEHRNYLPVAGLFAGVAAQLSSGLSTSRHLRSIAVAGLSLALALTGLTIARNRVWSDSVTLWSDALAKEPDNLRAMLALGNTYLRRDNQSAAETNFEQCLAAGYRLGQPHFVDICGSSLGLALLNRGDTAGAQRVLSVLQKTLADSPRVRLLQAELSVSEGQSREALAALEKVPYENMEDFDRALLATIQGDALRDLGQHDTAIVSYSRAIEAEPELAAAYFGRGMSTLALGNPDAAVKDLRHAVEYDPHHVKARSTLADLLVVHKRNPEEALQILDSAPEGSRAEPDLLVTRGLAELVLKNDSAAEEAFESALSSGGSPADVELVKARGYLLRGEMDRVKERLESLRTMKDASPQQKQIAENLLLRLKGGATP